MCFVGWSLVTRSVARMRYTVQTLLGRPIGKTVEFEVHSSLSPGQSATWAMPITHSRMLVAMQQIGRLRSRGRLSMVLSTCLKGVAESESYMASARPYGSSGATFPRFQLTRGIRDDRQHIAM